MVVLITSIIVNFYGELKKRLNEFDNLEHPLDGREYKTV